MCDYFGVKIAMYFAYLGHYTAALLWPAFLGTVLWLLSGTHQVNSCSISMMCSRSGSADGFHHFLPLTANHVYIFVGSIIATFFLILS